MSDTAPRSRWTTRTDPRSGVRSAVVWETLDTLLTEQLAALGRERLDVVDIGGGTGGFAVPLAELGHRVTVVDPSPDALASLQRRAAEAGVGELVRAEQGDAGCLEPVLGIGAADLVLCHGVLEYVEDPAAAVADLLAVLRPGGLASLLVAQRLGAMLARALSGRFDQAHRLLEDPEGRYAETDPVPRRFDQDSVLALFAAHRVTVRAVHGVRFFVDLLPGALVDGDPDTAEALLRLERAVSDHTRYPVLAAAAAQLHLVVQRPAGELPTGG